MINKDFLISNGFRDSKGNVLMFRACGIEALGIRIKKEGNLLLCIDTQNCCEGIIEETDGSFDDIKDILLSNGYIELFDEFKSKCKK